MSSQCPACRAAAEEMALENWLDDKGLRSPHPDVSWAYIYDPALVDEAEVAQWAQALLENDFPDMGYHEKNGHGG